MDNGDNGDNGITGITGTATLILSRRTHRPPALAAFLPAHQQRPQSAPHHFRRVRNRNPRHPWHIRTIAPRAEAVNIGGSEWAEVLQCNIFARVFAGTSMNTHCRALSGCLFRMPRAASRRAAPRSSRPDRAFSPLFFPRLTPWATACRPFRGCRVPPLFSPRFAHH